jgi:transcription elongation factor Elf1
MGTTKIPPLYFCPDCNALYQLVQIEAGSETNYREITCSNCGTPFPAREGKFVLKYFMLRKAARTQKWKRE